MVKQRYKESKTNMKLNIDGLGEDLLHNILKKLPALSCASAACVSRSWNRIISSRILSAPKLSSAFSLNPSFQDAVNEVFEKVLLEPIRPQFAIAFLGQDFDLKEAHKLITKRLGSQIPVVTSVSQGILGRDALTDEFKEVQWEVTDDEDYSDDNFTSSVGRRGILLTIGHLPGLKANLISLRGRKVLKGPLIDDFVIKVREWTSSVSDKSSPTGLIFFSDYKTDVKPVLEKMECAFPSETIIVGDGGGQFLYQSGCRNNTSESSNFNLAAVALVFASDRNKPPGIGETQFHLMLSTSVSPIGPRYKAVSVKEGKSDYSTWLTARRESSRENLDGQTILDHIYNEIGEQVQYPAFYIGVTKRRKCSVGADKVRWLTFHEFHEVLGGDEEYLYVNNSGIKTGDSFCFYFSNPMAGRSSCKKVSDNFRQLKQHCDRDCDIARVDGSDKKMVFGGIIFSCCGRGESFFGESNVDSLPFRKIFPGTPLAGTFCAGEIGRANMGFYGKESLEESSIPCSLHVFSSVYLVMSYSPPVAP